MKGGSGPTPNFVICSYQLTKIFLSGHDSTSTSSGPSGMTTEHLRPLLDDSRALHSFYRMCDVDKGSCATVSCGIHQIRPSYCIDETQRRSEGDRCRLFSSSSRHHNLCPSECACRHDAHPNPVPLLLATPLVIHEKNWKCQFSLHSCSQSSNSCNRSLCTSSRPSFFFDFCFRFLLVYGLCMGFP